MAHFIAEVQSDPGLTLPSPGPGIDMTHRDAFYRIARSPVIAAIPMSLSVVRTVDKISVASELMPVTRGCWTSQAQTRRCNAGAHSVVSLGNVS